MHLSRSTVQQRSNDLLALAGAPGVRTLNVDVSTFARLSTVNSFQLEKYISDLV
jgi:hypothetical protein